ncbi:MAG: hypothetical protein NTZ95_07515 [Candidatus Omnitrophica bacterium]|nr:hypothetical protein [Candidatus Omnitrophota bacterium]
MANKIKTVLSLSCPILFLIIAIGLFSLNISGIFFKSLRNPEIYSEKSLRFPNDITLNLEEFKRGTIRLPNESNEEFAIRLNRVVQKGLAHIDWKKCDIDKYFLRIPPWENYILFILNYSPYDNVFKRYHFCNYNKTIERGIGNCGDAAIVLSCLLENNGIKSKIAAYPGHVIIEVKIDKKNDIWWIFDPDFGVILPYSIKELTKNPVLAGRYYYSAGYSKDDTMFMEKVFAASPKIFSNYFTFSPKRTIFEYISYLMIWLIPLGLVILSLTIFKAGAKTKKIK